MITVEIVQELIKAKYKGVIEVDDIFYHLKRKLKKLGMESFRSYKEDKTNLYKVIAWNPKTKKLVKAEDLNKDNAIAKLFIKVLW